MTKEEINKAFENRWRIYGKKGKSTEIKAVKDYARQFFEAGVLIGMAHDSQEDTPDIVEVDFETWWTLYDKRVGKAKCMKLWQKLTKKERQSCIERTPSYVASTSDKQFRKNPETFLRNKSWNDEVIIRNNTDLQRNKRLAESANLVAKYTGTEI